MDALPGAGHIPLEPGAAQLAPWVMEDKPHTSVWHKMISRHRVESEGSLAGPRGCPGNTPGVVHDLAGGGGAGW